MPCVVTDVTMNTCSLISSCRTRDGSRESCARVAGSGYRCVAGWAAMRLSMGIRNGARGARRREGRTGRRRGAGLHTMDGHSSGPAAAEFPGTARTKT